MIDDKLDSILRIRYDAYTAESSPEKNNAEAMFQKLCKKNGVNSEEYRQDFLSRKSGNSGGRTSYQNSRSGNTTGGGTKNQQNHKYGDPFGFDYEYDNPFSSEQEYKDFWEKIFGKGWRPEYKGGSTYQKKSSAGPRYYYDGIYYDRKEDRDKAEAEDKREKEKAKREKQEREKRKKMFPEHTLRNIRYRVEKSKLRWAFLIECEEWVDGMWLTAKFVIFSDVFEFPKGYRDMMFIYDTNNRAYYRGYINITTLWYYENGRKIKIFDVEMDTENDIQNKEILKEFLYEATYSEMVKNGNERIFNDFKQETIDKLKKDDTIDPETIIIESVMAKEDVTKRTYVVAIKVRYKYVKNRPPKPEKK